MKNSKIKYYLKNIIRLFIPSIIYQKRLNHLLNSIDENEIEYIFERVNYYNKIEKDFEVKGETIKEFKKKKKKTYFFDLIEYLRYFNPSLKCATLFGDITEVPSTPTLLKSRPISDDNQNSVLLNLDKIRHFLFLKDPFKFSDKKNLLVWRGGAYQPHRKKFITKFYNHPLCNVGQTNKPIENVPWQKPKMSIREQLKYKFILSIEGNDVASNLKWIMSSNSLVFSPKLKYETWFMEGKLIPNYHFVLLNDDFSNLEEKIEYYSKNQKEAMEIIKNSNDYIKQFQNKKREDLISLLVLYKYFEKSGQI